MTESLRVVTLNIHKGLSQFNRRMVIHELRDSLRTSAPDLVFLQEVQGMHARNAMRFSSWPVQPQHEYLAGELWEPVYGRNAVYAHGHHGNAILSRFRVVSVSNEDVSDHRFERRGLLHSVLEVPGWSVPLHCVCLHLSLHERGRRRQLHALAARFEQIAAQGLPMIVAGDFNDWRQRAGHVLAERLGMTEVSVHHHGRAARTFPSLLPVLRLDRIYVRGFTIVAAEVLRDARWALLSDHLALSAELRRSS